MPSPEEDAADIKIILIKANFIRLLNIHLLSDPTRDQKAKDEDAKIYLTRFTKLQNSLKKVESYFIQFCADYDLNSETLQKNNPNKTIDLNNRPTLAHIRATTKIRDDINQLIDHYENSGNAFLFFSQHQDRGLAIKKLAKDMNQIFDSNPSTTKSTYCTIIHTINDTIEQTRESHQRNSLAGALGLTESRLANKLTDYVKQLMKEQNITPTDLEEHKLLHANHRNTC